MKYILALILFFGSLSLSAQSIESRYRSHISNSGITYFFVPKSISKTDNTKSFIFDMTYLENNDSITLNFTVLNDSPASVTAFKILADDGLAYEAKNVSRLYRDVTRKGYEIRTTSKFLYSEMRELFANNEPLIFEIQLSNGVKCVAKYGKREWKKEKERITKIFNSISYN